MLIDVIFFGIPFIVAVCLGGLAMREGDSRFGFAGFSWMAYCLFYLVGGREVLLFLGAKSLGTGSWLSIF